MQQASELNLILHGRAMQILNCRINKIISIMQQISADRGQQNVYVSASVFQLILEFGLFLDRKRKVGKRPQPT